MPDGEAIPDGKAKPSGLTGPSGTTGSVYPSGIAVPVETVGAGNAASGGDAGNSLFLFSQFAQLIVYLKGSYFSNLVKQLKGFFETHLPTKGYEPGQQLATLPVFQQDDTDTRATSLAIKFISKPYQQSQILLTLTSLLSRYGRIQVLLHRKAHRNQLPLLGRSYRGPPRRPRSLGPCQRFRTKPVSPNASDNEH